MEKSTLAQRVAKLERLQNRLEAAERVAEEYAAGTAVTLGIIMRLLDANGVLTLQDVIVELRTWRTHVGATWNLPPWAVGSVLLADLENSRRRRKPSRGPTR